MADQLETANSTAAASPAPATPAKRGRPKSKKTGTVPHRPPTSEMVIEAIENLQERGGSSLQAIKKYIVTTFKLDANKQAHFIKKYLRAAVGAGILTQTKGTGAAGSFKIAVVKPEVTKTRSQRVAARHSTAKTADTPQPAAEKPVAGSKAAAKESSPASTKEKRKIVKSPAAKPPKAKKQTKAKKAAKPAISKTNTPTKIEVQRARATPKKSVSPKKK